MSDEGTAQNEVGWEFATVTVVQSLPNSGRRLPLDRTGEVIHPRHALINIEGGDVRYRLDGSDPTAQIGILGRNGTDIDWTDSLRDFRAFIAQCRIVAVAGPVVLNISYRD